MKENGIKSAIHIRGLGHTPQLSTSSKTGLPLHPSLRKSQVGSEEKIRTKKKSFIQRTKCIRNTLMRKAGKTQGSHGGCMIFTFTKVFVLLELLLPSFSLARTCWLCCLVICKLQQVWRFYWNTLSSSSVDKMMGMDLWNCTLPNSWLS